MWDLISYLPKEDQEKVRKEIEEKARQFSENMTNTNDIKIWD
jgi:hypothetical protein